jgi:hypothetical protein
LPRRPLPREGRKPLGPLRFDGWRAQALPERVRWPWDWKLLLVVGVLWWSLYAAVIVGDWMDSLGVAPIDPVPVTCGVDGSCYQIVRGPGDTVEFTLVSRGAPSPRPADQSTSQEVCFSNGHCYEVVVHPGPRQAVSYRRLRH